MYIGNWELKWGMCFPLLVCKPNRIWFESESTIVGNKWVKSGMYMHVRMEVAINEVSWIHGNAGRPAGGAGSEWVLYCVVPFTTVRRYPEFPHIHWNHNQPHSHSCCGTTNPSWLPNSGYISFSSFITTNKILITPNMGLEDGMHFVLSMLLR